MRHCSSLLPGLLLIGCLHAPDRPELAVADPPPTQASAYLAGALRDGDLLIGAQPKALDLEALDAVGIRTIINLRTADEMAALEYDEAAVARSLGLHYIHRPVGGSDHPYTPELLDAFALAMEENEGKVLLHCAGGGRAAQLYAAWLVKHRGNTPQQAMQALATFGGWPLPMERLLGEPLHVGLAEHR